MSKFFKSSINHLVYSERVLVFFRIVFCRRCWVCFRHWHYYCLVLHIHLITLETATWFGYYLNAISFISPKCFKIIFESFIGLFNFCCRLFPLLLLFLNGCDAFRQQFLDIRFINLQIACFFPRGQLFLEFQFLLEHFQFTGIFVRHQFSKKQTTVCSPHNAEFVPVHICILWELLNQQWFCI